MSYFYGASAGGFAKDNKGQLAPVWHDKAGNRGGLQPGTQRNWLDAIFNCIEDMLPRPKGGARLARAPCQSWPQRRISRCAGQRRSDCRSSTSISRQISRTFPLWLNGRRRSTKLAVGDKDGINKKKAENAITANFVHSADAAHLQLVALAAAKEGINMVSVHDCFGTIAPDAGRLNDIIRDQFIDLHKRHNWLNNFGRRQNATSRSRAVFGHWDSRP